METPKPLRFSGSNHEIQGRRQTKSRLYVWIRGESVMENLMNRKSRPHHVYKALVQPLLDSLGVKAKWNQYAGCSCPCSPGFVLDKLVCLDKKRPWVGHDLHVTIEVLDDASIVKA